MTHHEFQIATAFVVVFAFLIFAGLISLIEILTNKNK